MDGQKPKRGEVGEVVAGGKKKSFLFKNKLWIGKIPLLVVVVVIVVVYLKRRQSICF